MIDEDVFAQPDEPAKVGVEGWEDGGRWINLYPDDITQPVTDLVYVGGRRVHLDAQPDGAGNGCAKLRILDIVFSERLARQHSLEDVVIL